MRLLQKSHKLCCVVITRYGRVKLIYHLQFHPKEWDVMLESETVAGTKQIGGWNHNYTIFMDRQQWCTSPKKFMDKPSNPVGGSLEVGGYCRSQRLSLLYKSYNRK